VRSRAVGPWALSLRDGGASDHVPSDHVPSDHGPADRRPPDRGPSDRGRSRGGPADRRSCDHGPAVGRWAARARVAGRRPADRQPWNDGPSERASRDDTARPPQHGAAAPRRADRFEQYAVRPAAPTTLRPAHQGFRSRRRKRKHARPVRYLGPFVTQTNTTAATPFLPPSCPNRSTAPRDRRSRPGGRCSPFAAPCPNRSSVPHLRPVHVPHGPRPPPAPCRNRSNGVRPSGAPFATHR
jgi:hypothetical protein